MKITWLGHSCFVLEENGFQILLDPYRDVPGWDDISIEADAVYCSHGHFDHAYTEKVRLRSGKRNPFTVRDIPSFHDEQGGKLRGKNMIRRFTAGGVSVTHMGDLGHQLDAEQLAALSGVDALLLPVGGTYTIDAYGAKAVADAVGAKVIVPMHYHSGEYGLPVLLPVDAFIKLFPAELVQRYPGHTLELTPDTPRQIAVLALP